MEGGMDKRSARYGIGGLLIGIVIAWATATIAVNNNNSGIMRTMGMRTTTDNQGMMSDSDMTMGQMMTGLQDKTGDDFDNTFLSEMIMHHQGAVDMANFAKNNAKHDEIKNMANDIIAAQTKEINQMQTWQNQWGYGTSSGQTHDHSSMMGN